MAKRKPNSRPVQNQKPVGSGAKAVATVENAQPVQNGLSAAVGCETGGFPQQLLSSISSEPITSANTIFKNLRYYLVSNFRQILSEAYVEIGLIQTIVDVPVDDAFRGGIEIKSSQLSPEQVEDLQTAIERDDDLTTVAQGGKWNRLFGGSAILVITDQDPETPLDLEAIGEDTPIEFRAVDLWELYNNLQSTEEHNTIIEEEMEEIELSDFFNYYGERVHKSRVMLIKGLTPPSFIRPRLRGWGFSVVEALVRSINQYLKATNLSFEVLDEFKLDVYKIKNLVNTLMSPNGDENVRRRVQLANWQKNYQNAVVMDSEDDFDHKQLSFAGLGEAMTSIRMQVASDMRMPITKLFGISAAGFNSGEDDIEVYNAMVEGQVRSKLKFIVLRVIEIKCQKLFGFIPDDLKVTFKPLRVLSAEQEETVKTQKFTRLLQARERGEITSEEFREACNKDNLLPIALDTSIDMLAIEGSPDEAGEQDDTGGEDATGDKAPAKEAKKTGSPGKAPAKAKDAPEPKVLNAEWDESKHPRADDGKFGTGGGSGGSTDTGKKYKEKFKTGDKYHSSGTKEEALAKAKELRAQGIHATVWHVDGPKTGKKSEYAVAVPDENKKQNELTIMPKPYSNAERVQRAIRNSAAFDRASYLADGGDGWIDPRRQHFFEHPKDPGLWAKAVSAASKAGSSSWQFRVWLYKKLGGKF